MQQIVPRSYGSSELAVLMAQYGQTDKPILTDDVHHEWTTFRNMLASYSTLSLQQMLRMLARKGSMSDAFPQLSQVAAIALILPVTMAEGERCFSTMKRIKTDLRNRIGGDMLEHLMRIYVEGPTMKDMDFKSAVGEFAAMHARRLNFVQK